MGCLQRGLIMLDDAAHRFLARRGQHLAMASSEVTVKSKERAYYSRIQVLAEGEPAWTMDQRGVVHHFDGSRIRRRESRSDRYALVASWRSPASGWMHLADCSCRGCAPD
jgi:hypothetical protein